jgi:hypothetical protein
MAILDSNPVMMKLKPSMLGSSPTTRTMRRRSTTFAWHLIFRHHRGQEVLALVNRAIDVAGEIPSLLNTRALAFMDLGQSDPALSDAKRVLASEPSGPSAYFHLARAHLIAKNERASRKAFERAQELGLTLETVDPLGRDSFQNLRQELNPR